GARARDRQAATDRHTAHHRGRRRGARGADRQGDRHRDPCVPEVAQDRGRLGRYPGVLREARADLQREVTWIWVSAGASRSSRARREVSVEPTPPRWPPRAARSPSSTSTVTAPPEPPGRSRPPAAAPAATRATSA